MKKITFLMLFLCLAATWLPAQHSEKYAQVQIDLTGKNIAELAALGIETEHAYQVPGRFIQVILSESELALVQSKGYATETLIPDVQAWERARAHEPAATLRDNGCTGGNYDDYETPQHYAPGTMAGYFRYQEMLDILDTMAALYPNLITTRAIVSDTILTHEGRPLWWIKVSDNPSLDEAQEPQVLYTALHHAREPNSMSQMIFYLWYLLEHYDTDPEIKYLIDNEELYFIPCVNPDGYLYNEFTNPDGYGYWRKNRRDNGDGSYGVDLNRNYGYEWGYNDTGSSPFTGSETYRGPAGFSEPETRMLRDFCLLHPFSFVLNYHTSGNLLIYPWGYADDLADPALAELAQLFVRENHFTAGVATETVGYYVNGTSDDWMYGETGAFAYTPEVGPSFWPPMDMIDQLNKSNMWQNLAMARCALRFGEVIDQSPLSFSVQDFDLPFSLRRYGFEHGPFTVSLTPLTTNVATASAPQNFDLEQFETASGIFEVTLSPSAQAGQVIRLALTLSSGAFSHTDTLVKTLGGSSVSGLVDGGNDLDNWTTSAWSTTTEQFVSPPTSLTDSPDDVYFPNDNNSLLLITPVFIPADAIDPRLHFYARWEIEDYYDYLVVTAAGDDGNYQALCGLYTTPGSFFQLADQPIYDGSQPNWVEESMSLANYAGQTLNLGFSLISNESVEYDGFYLDDIRIDYIDPLNVGTVSVPLTQFRLLQNQPNPTADRTTVRWENPAALKGTGTLVVFNSLGEKMTEQKVNLNDQQAAVLETRTWPAGIYTYQLQSSGWQSPALKLVVQR